MRLILLMALLVGSLAAFADASVAPVIYVNYCRANGFETGIGAVIQGESVYWDAENSNIDGLVEMESEEGLVVLFCSRPLPDFNPAVDPLPPGIVDPVPGDDPFGPYPYDPRPYPPGPVFPQPVVPYPMPEPGFSANPSMPSSPSFGF